MYCKPVLIFLLVLIASACNEPTDRVKAATADKTGTVYLQPLGADNKELLNFLKNEIEQFYGCSAVVLKQQPTPDSCYIQSRERYNAIGLLRHLRQLNPEADACIQGVIAEDICTPKDGNPCWGIFGLGYCPGSASIISTNRIKPRSADKKIFYRRMANVSLHEIGHNIGLPHCKSKTCLMRSAKGNIENVSDPNPVLCYRCREQLIWGK